jgi:hypothetical protein
MTAAAEAGQPLRNGVGALEVVQQPAVQTLIAERRLHGADIHRHRSFSIEGVRSVVTNHAMNFVSVPPLA